MKKTIGYKLLSKIHPINNAAFIAYQNQLLLKAYSANTQRIYLSEFAELLGLFDSYSIQNLTPKCLKDYFLYCVNTLHQKERKLNGKINAIKFYFEQVLHRPKIKSPLDSLYSS